MALTPLLSSSHPTKNHLSPSITCNLKPTFQPPKPVLNTLLHCKPTPTTTRRTALTTSTMAAAALLFLSTSFTKDKANAFDFRITVPDQTIEEAEGGIRGHAQALVVEVKELIESGEWKEAQKELRKNAAYLKQDIYTIIQNKPGSERPYLRKMYSTLFNNVTKLDYAARDRDEVRVLEFYGNIVVALGDILSRI